MNNTPYRFSFLRTDRLRRYRTRNKISLLILFPGILLLCLFVSCSSGFNEYVVRTEFKSLTWMKEIVPVKDSLVIPVIYSNVISLDTVPVHIKKEKFIDLLLPSVLVVKYRHDQTCHRLLHLREKAGTKRGLSAEDSLYLNRLFETFKAGSLEELIPKLKTHPVSMVLAQAALESGWGTSRFFHEANNIFGLWSFNSSEPRMKTSGSRNGRIIYVKWYEDLTGSIEDYFIILGRVSFYEDFRKERLQNNAVSELLPLLKRYSELGNEYTRMLEEIITANDLTRFDHYRIHPDYIKRKRTRDKKVRE